MKPEILDIGPQKIISYTTGQSQSLESIMNWTIKAIMFIKYYNGLPKEKRKNKYEEMYPDQNYNFLINCFADENGNGYEIWLEVIPKDADNFMQLNEPSDQDLELVATEYDHNMGPIENIEHLKWKDQFTSEQINELRKIKHDF